MHVIVFSNVDKEYVRTGNKRGSHILMVGKAVSLKNIEELVHDREAIWEAETCPPIRAM